MKKLLAVLVVFALIAGATFAETSVGGEIGGGVSLFGSNGEKYTDPDDPTKLAGPDLIVRAIGTYGRIDVNGRNEEGTFGATVRTETREGSGEPFAFAWWQPISQVKVQLGHNDWGDWGKDDIVGWGFTAAAQTHVAINSYGTGGNDIGAGTGFYGGIGGFAALLSVYPIDGLAINIGIPLANNDDTLVADGYARLHAQVTYAISGAGTAAITFRSNTGKAEIGTNGFEQNPAAIYASFNLSAIENLGLNFGLGFTLPSSAEGELSGVRVKIAKSNPLEIGLGFNYSLGTINIKARLATTLAGSTETTIGGTSVKVSDPFKLGFSILPSFDIGIMNVYVNAGIMFSGTKQDSAGKDIDDSSAFGWHFNPYITKSAGPGTFYAGFKLESDGVKGSSKDGDASAIRWSVPIGIIFGL